MLYCECDTPIIDIDHDAGCRRCGRPVDFSPARIAVEDFESVDGAATACVYDREAEYVLETFGTREEATDALASRCYCVHPKIGEDGATCSRCRREVSPWRRAVEGLTYA